MILQLRALLFCDFFLILAWLHIAQLHVQARPLEVVGKSYRLPEHGHPSSKSRSLPSLPGTGQPVDEKVEIILVAREPAQSDQHSPTASYSNKSASRLRSRRHSNCNKCMRKLSSDTSICSIKSSHGIETVVQNHTDTGFLLKVVHVSQHDLLEGQTSTELLQLYFPSPDRFSSHFGECSCDPGLLDKKGNDKRHGLQFHISLSKQTSKSTEEIVVKLVKRLVKLACSKEDWYGIDGLQVKVATSTSTPFETKALRLATEEEKHSLTLKVYLAGNKDSNFKAGMEDEKGTAPVSSQPTERGQTAQSSPHKSGSKKA